MCKALTVLHLWLAVEDGDKMKNLSRVNKNNFSRLPRAKKELSEQMATAVCQFLASCMCLSILMQDIVIVYGTVGIIMHL